MKWQGANGNVWFTGENKAKSHASSILDALNKEASKERILSPVYRSATD